MADKLRTEDVLTPLAFWFLFPHEQAARISAATLHGEGFLVDPQLLDELGDWRLGAFKQLSLVVGHDLRNSMGVLASQHDGVYLGYEICSGESPYPPKEPRGRIQR